MGKIIVVTSAVGGSGVSSACVAMGAQAASAGQRVLVLEAHTGVRVLDHLTGVEEQLLYDMADVAEGRCTLREVWVASPLFAGLWVMPGPVQWDMFPSPLCWQQWLRECARWFDCILVDCPFASPVFPAVAAMATDLAVLCSPDANAERAATVLRTRLPESYGGEARLVITPYDEKMMLARRNSNDLDAVIDRVGLRLLGVVVQDVRFAACLEQHSAAVTGTEAWYAWGRCCRRLWGEDVPLPSDLL